MNRKASFNGLTTALVGLSDEEQLALVDAPEELKRFAAELAAKSAENIFFAHLADNEVPEKFQETVGKWRRLAAELGYAGPIVWKVRKDFTLKAHAPKAGPCYEKFDYLQDWNLKNDEPTTDALVFFIPRFLAGSKNKNVKEQLALLFETRQRFGLLEHHLSSFGSAAMLSGLILAHFKRAGERVPLNKEATRTDTLRSVGDRLGLGDFGGGGLGCGSWHWGGGGDRDSDVGCFPLGVELGK